jgi:tetratricopeptide (TPR) repeat protein
MKSGNWGAAEQEYRAALQYDSSSFNGSIYWYQLGYALLMQNRWTEAESALRQSIAVRPPYAYAQENLAHVLEKLGREKEAEEEYLAALRLDPGFSEAQDALIRIVGNRRVDINDIAFKRALDLKDASQREAAWRQYLVVNPGSSAVYNNLGVALKEQGRLLEADAAFREAARLDPGNAKVKENLTDLKSREGYGEMLTLAQEASFWGQLAAGNRNEAMKWMSMKCFDTGCSYVSDPSTAVRLLAPPGPGPKTPEPSPAVRNDPVIAGLRKEKQALENRYKESFEALKAVWDAKERGKGDKGTLDILEYQHKNDMTGKISAIRTAEIKIKERTDKLDLGVVLPGQ